MVAASIILATLFIAYVCWWIVRYNGPLRQLPGVRPVWPMMGNIFQFQVNSVHSSIEELAVRFQYKPFELWFGPRHSVMVSEPDLAKRILCMRPVRFHRCSNGSNVLNDTWGGTGVFTAEGHDWARQRRLTAPLFNKLNASTMFAPITLSALSILKKWTKALEKSQPSNSEEVFINHDCNHFTLNVILSVAFGIEKPWESADGDETRDQIVALRNDIELVVKHIANRMFSPYKYWKYLPKFLLPKIDRDFEVANSRMMQHIGRILGEYKSRIEDDRSSVPDNLLSRMILASQTEGDKSETCPMLKASSRLKLTDKEVVSNTNLFLFAGTDTTASSLCWTIWFLAKNPSVQSSARSQICDHFSKVNFKDKDPVEILNDALLSASFVGMIDAIFKESLRLKSPTPLLAFDPNEDNMKLDGLDISLSKSDQIIILTRLISVSESYFGADAKEWKPERWLAPSSTGSVDSEALKMLEDHFLSFGYGPRMCLGRDLAYLEARVFIVLLLLAFELEPALGVKEVGEHFALTMRPEPIHIQIKRTRDNAGQKLFESFATL